VEVALRQQPDFSALRLGLINNRGDALNHFPKNNEHLAAFYDGNLAKRYAAGELCVILRFRASQCACNYDLIANPRESCVIKGQSVDAKFQLASFIPKLCLVRNAEDGSVLCEIADFIHGPENVIASTVRAEASKKRLEVIGQISASAVKATFEISFGSRKGEVRLVGVGSRCKIRDVHSGMVKGGAQVFNCCNCLVGKRSWQRFCKSRLVDFISGVRIWLDYDFGFSAPKEPLGASFKLSQIFLSPADSLPCTVEGVAHGG
jgi:hypothetical protein